jgi:hypothetical protein
MRTSCLRWTQSTDLLVYSDWLEDQGEVYLASWFRALGELKVAVPSAELTATSAKLLDWVATCQKPRIDIPININNEHASLLTDAKVIWEASASEKAAWRRRGVVADRPYDPTVLHKVWPCQHHDRPLVPRQRIEDALETDYGLRINPKYAAWALRRWENVKFYRGGHDRFALINEGRLVAVLMAMRAD